MGEGDADGADAADDSVTDDSVTDEDPGIDDAPLAELVREVRAKRAAREEGETAGLDPETDPFESVEVDEVDEDAVWEALAEGETGPEAQVGVGADPETTADPDETVVPKAEFCSRCPHFADPPETACTHEGTTIVEVVDADRFRVRNCPIVAEERASPDVE
ncbi:hypothetical protein [Haloplanus halophilus]|uniref:hypothetical protein n=1 Tax=Haloplanus halophilus TaxID=2949993 RepID=UPI00203E1A77|nr:hypothetical protein [Haloplanus sp. GDY1]